MDSGQLVAIIIGIIVVLAVVAVAIILSRKRKVQANRTRAAEIRERAQADEFSAKEREAKAARAEADAQQAEVEAERLRREALERQREAESVRAESQEQLRKADELDPDVVTGQRGDARPGGGGAADETARAGGAPGQLHGGRASQEDAGDGAARTAADDQNRGDRPRNL